MMAIDVAGRGTRSQRSSSGWGSTLGTGHPNIMFGAAAVETLFFVSLGIGFGVTRSVGAGVAMCLVGVAVGALTCIPAFWSRRHLAEAKASVRHSRDQRDAELMTHPVRWGLGTGFLCVIVAVGRASGDGFHTESTIVAGVLAAIFAAGATTVFTIQAHHRAHGPH
jgi:hypothetical protein